VCGRACPPASLGGFACHLRGARPAPSIGFLVAWGYVLVGALVPPFVLLQLGFTAAATINAEVSGYPANLW
jgi:hypothetical protein